MYGKNRDMVYDAIMDLTKAVNEVHSEVKDLRTEINGLREELHSEVNGLREEIGNMRSEIRTEINDLRKDMHTHFNRMESDFDFVRFKFIRDRKRTSHHEKALSVIGGVSGCLKR